MKQYNIVLNSSPKQGAVNVRGTSPRPLGIQLNPALLFPTAGWISSVLRSPHWACPLIKVTRKQMDVHGSKSPKGSKVSKVVVKPSQSADGGCKISQAAQRPSSGVQALMNKSCFSSQYSGMASWAAFVIHLSPDHPVTKRQKCLMIRSLWTACT